MKTIVALAAVGLTLASSAGGVTAQAPSGATAEVKDASGSVVGTATFAQVADGVQVSARFRGLPPGPHGIHVHAVGQCEPPFASAGGHFNPAGHKHGLRNPEGPHAGDLPNLMVAADGTGSISALARGATLSAGQASLFDADGSALVIHANADDDVTDPAGNSGDRIACGVLAQAALGGGPGPAQLPRAGDLGPGGLGTALPALAGLGAMLTAAGVVLRRRQVR